MLTVGQRFASRSPSPLRGLDDATWERLHRALDVQPFGATSARGGFGSYDFRPKRLEELGAMEDVRHVRSEAGRLVPTGSFTAPWSGFMRDPIMQRTALARSLALYEEEIARGALRVPEGLALPEALALLHRAARGGFERWPLIFSETEAFLDQVRCRLHPRSR